VEREGTNYELKLVPMSGENQQQKRKSNIKLNVSKISLR